MKWSKGVRIVDVDDVSLSKHIKRLMVPVPYRLEADVIRLFITFCGDDNVGEIGFIDVDAENPSQVIRISDTPSLTAGALGAFDDNGVVTASVIPFRERLLLYYSGFQLATKVPYFIFSGIANSFDRGESFTRLKRVPILDRTNSEMFTRCAPVVEPFEGGLRLWYTGDLDAGWTEREGRKVPLYGLKTVQSKHIDVWPDEAHEVFSLDQEKEHGISLPSFWRENNLWKMIYSIRTYKGYRLGYAESTDGKQFVRKDDEVGIQPSEEGWDSSMICFGRIFRHDDKTYLFYCGNDYGAGGLGYATLLAP